MIDPAVLGQYFIRRQLTDKLQLGQKLFRLHFIGEIFLPTIITT
jgi:hypothetical protein